jgi:hypothetical protein
VALGSESEPVRTPEAVGVDAQGHTVVLASDRTWYYDGPDTRSSVSYALLRSDPGGAFSRFGPNRLVSTDIGAISVTLAVGIMAGNAVGTRVLEGLSKEAFRRLLLGAPLLAAIELLVTAV